MQYIGTPEQIRKIDRLAIEDFGMPGVILMENAGRGAGMVALDMLGSRPGGKALILCGKGNNGGDGFVIARHLSNAGVRVEIVLTAKPSDVDPDSDAGVNLGIIRRMKLPILPVESTKDAERVGRALASANLAIDALLGTGLSGQVREPARALIEMLNAAACPVLAVDTPSGLHGESGEILGVAVKATRTATFAAAKRGFYAGEGPALTGTVHLIDIGVPIEILAPLKTGG